MAHPKNVQAILDWYKQHQPGGEAHIQNLLVREQDARAAGGNELSMQQSIAIATIAVMLQAFEAGREFQKANPGCESGPGYLAEDRPEPPPVREPSKPHPNLSDDINNAIANSEIEGGVWVVKPSGAAVKDEPYLPVGKGLLVTTRNTRYTIRKTGEESFTIQGHPKYCPVPTVAYIHGSTFGGSMIKMGWIGRGMYLEFSTVDHREAIKTSQIQDVVEIP